jgi:diacylglycerol O-acyltransferase
MSTLDAEFFPTRADLMRLFEAKLPRVPRYRQVVWTTPFQVLRPVWADDQEFAIRHHVRHASVRAPGGQEQLQAILSKVHHCMVDGGNDLMTQVFDTTPDERVPEVADWIPAPRPSLAELAAATCARP